MSGRAPSPSDAAHCELVLHSVASTPNATATSRRWIGSTPVTCPAPAALSAYENSSPIELLADHRDPRAAHIAEPADRVQHRAQRLDHGGVDRRKLGAEHGDLVGARNELLRQTEVPFRPSDHAGADREVVRRARLHLADHLVQRVARLAARGADEQVARAEEGRHVAAADAAASKRATTRPGPGSPGSSASTGSSRPGAISVCAHIGAEPTGARPP